jgi:hypothetical protein
MLGYLKAIFDWFTNIGGTYLGGIWEILRKNKWILLTLVAALLAPIRWVLEVAEFLTGGIAEKTSELVGYFQQLRIGESGGLWSAVSEGAALMNCVVPLDVILSSFGVLLSIWLTIFGIKAAVWVYRLIPGKFT